MKNIINNLFGRSLIVILAATAMMGCASSSSFATPPAAAPAPATPATAVNTAETVTVTTYKGRDGVRELLASMKEKQVPAGKVAIQATSAEIVNGSLDSLEDNSVHESGASAKALTMAIEAAKKLDADMVGPMAETIVQTHDAWIVTAAPPPWPTRT